MIAYQTVQNALADFIQSQLGLADGQVRWENQNAPEPPKTVRSWISLDAGDLIALGSFDTRQIYATPNPDPATSLPPAAGAEVSIRTTGLRNLPLSIQAYTRDTSVGSGSARELLSNLLDVLRSREGAQALFDVGFGVSGLTAVRNLTALVNAQIQGRALLEVMLQLTATLLRKVGYIATVAGTLKVNGGTSGGGQDLPFTMNVPAHLPP